MKAKYYPARDCFRIIVPGRLSETGKDQSKYFKTKEQAEAEIGRIMRRGTSVKPVIDDRKLAILTVAESELGSVDQILEAIRHYRATVVNAS